MAFDETNARGRALHGGVAVQGGDRKQALAPGKRTLTEGLGSVSPHGPELGADVLSRLEKSLAVIAPVTDELDAAIGRRDFDTALSRRSLLEMLLKGLDHNAA